MLIILLQSTNPTFNLAAEEYLLKHFEEDIFMLWRNDSSIIIGKYQNTAAEINVEFVKERGIRVVRRQTGGGAVFHDLGNLNYTFIAPKGSGDFRTFSDPVIRFLNRLGVPAKFEGRNDLTIEGRKFSGNAQCVYCDRILHHGTLLFASQMADLSAALKVNPLKFQDKAVKSVRKRVTNISEHLSQPMSVTEFAEGLSAFVCAEVAAATPYEFTEADLAAIAQLQKEKYETWEWNFGASPRYDFTQQARTAAGTVEVGLTIDKGRIAQCRIQGDFFSQAGVEPLEAGLIGLDYQPATVCAALRNLPVSDCICGLTPDELSALVCGE